MKSSSWSLVGKLFDPSFPQKDCEAYCMGRTETEISVSVYSTLTRKEIVKALQAKASEFFKEIDISLSSTSIQYPY